ncbi:hypothetical protein [Pseudomonas aeruginosa]|uniref:hypothetical protein n=1 Tax=Pseudomonas aeruginosa TaxID=287 RepID=UPI0015C5FEBB|nr:hypothetical protein [Pseudomonas aeruginosa]
MSNELTDVRCPCGAEFQADSYDAGFIAGSGMCQNCDAALPPKDICTCPSGDGSLVHPCPAHPAPVEHAGGDERDVQGAQGERQAFEAHESRERRLSPADQKFWFRRGAVADYDIKSIDDAWKAWKARAALAQPALQCKKCGGTGDADSGGIHPWGETAMVPCDCAHTERAQGKRTEDGDTIIDRLRLGGLTIDGDNAYKRDLLDCVVGALAFGFQGRPAPEETHWLHRFWEIGNAEREARAALAQPSPKCATCNGSGQVWISDEPQRHFEDCPDCAQPSPVPTEGFTHFPELLESVQQMDAMLKANSAQAEAERPEVVGYRSGTSGGIYADGYGLEKPEPLMTVAQHERIVGELRAERDGAIKLLGQSVWQKIERLTQERDAALARVAELDKQCRDDVARALGLLPSQERGFAWSYLLASIKSCVKASEDAAQAQHSVPEGWMLVPVEPTQAQLSAGQTAWLADPMRRSTTLYRAMLAAAPQPVTEGE